MIRSQTLSTLIFVFLISPLAMADNYGSVPTQAQRAEASSGFVLFTAFPRLELVQEDEGIPDLNLTNLITDKLLRTQINNGEFTSLQVRDLAIQTSKVYSVGTVIHFPYAISIKHTEGRGFFSTFNQGTINVAGEIEVQVTGQDLKVTVVKYDDSQTAERIGRDVGFNRGIDQDFAVKVTKPELEGWFNADPARIQALLSLGNAPLSQKP